MAHFQLREPAAGRMFSDQKWPSPASLSARNYRSLLIEPEIMAVMGADMPARRRGHDRASAEAAVARYLPAIELVDTRDLALPRARIASLLAQNIATEGLVFGGPGLLPQQLDVERLAVDVLFDDKHIAGAKGAAPQHPGDAIAWLADFLVRRGGMLKAGDIVMCGTHLPPPPLAGAGQVLVDMGPLGLVEFSIT